jgi:hypothetical protein
MCPVLLALLHPAACGTTHSLGHFETVGPHGWHTLPPSCLYCHLPVLLVLLVSCVSGPAVSVRYSVAVTKWYECCESEGG